MSIIQKELQTLSLADLQSLIDNQVIENKKIEYKWTLPGTSRAEKIEFLADVSSFSNASGGDIIYGVKAEAGVPKLLSGIDLDNIDAEKLRIDSMIQSGISPRIPGYRIHVIPIDSARCILMIRIPRSWILPHMVTLENSSRFHSRSSAGKYQLDVHEIRNLILGSQEIPEKIRNFRADRLSSIIAEETPILLDKTPKIVLHLIPFSAFTVDRQCDFSTLTSPPRPIYTNGWNHRHNFDGYLSYSQFQKSPTAQTYTQFYRNGIVEAVEAFMLGDSGKTIPSVLYEEELIESTSNYLKVLRGYSVEPPIAIMVSLSGVKGYTMDVDKHKYWRSENNPIEKDLLVVPEVLMERYEDNVDEVMKPIFDSIWNAAGWIGSLNYVNGHWRRG
jgi:hypothetical protein